MLPVLPHWAPLGEEAECQSRHIPSAWGFPAGKVFSWPCWGWNVQMYQGEAQQCLGAVQGKCIWCHTCLPGSTTGTGTGTGTAALQGEAADQTNSLSGAAKVSGAAHASSALPRRLFRKRRQLVEEVFVAGDQSPWQPPRFPVFSCCTARLCSWVCVPGGGRRRQGGGGGLGCAGAGTLGSALLPLPRKHGNGGQAPWHPWEGQVGGRYAREGG